MNRSFIYLIIIAALGFLARQVRAEEIWLADNTRIYGIVTGLKDNSLQITLPGSEVKPLPLEDIISIDFRGRTPRFLEVGTQEFLFQRGGVLRGEVTGQKGEEISVMSTASGPLTFDTRMLNGLIGLPMEGAVGRRAADLLAMEKGPNSPQLDQLLDRRGSRYPGVVQRVDRASVILDHEDVLRPVTFPWNEVAAVRLADADKATPLPLPSDAWLRITLRDGSRFDGVLQSIDAGAWHLRPLWERTTTIPLDINEVVSIQVMGGKVQYLSQLPVAEVLETPVIAPPHPYRMDRNCEGGGLAIGPLTFPWGIGVHANSQLTWRLDGRFNQFHATIGLDANIGIRGSVVFKVLGDGKELYHSPLIKNDNPPVEISIPIGGTKNLSLVVNDGDGSDLGDAANWAIARVVR